MTVGLHSYHMTKQQARGSANRRRRKPTKKQQRIYRRRRIVAGVAFVVILAVVVFCVVSLSKGVGAVSHAIHHDDIAAITRKSVPKATKSATSKVPDCAADDVKLSVTAASQSVALGGSLDFSMTETYVGTDQCLLDISNQSRVLTITSGDETIWKSDSCPADAQMILMAKPDKLRSRSDTLTWNTNRTGSECADDASLPKVDRGTYIAKLSLRDAPKAVSDPVVVVVE